MTYRNYTCRLQTLPTPPMSNGTASIQQTNPMSGKRFAIDKLIITCAAFNTDTGQFLNYDLTPDILSEIEIERNFLGGVPNTLVFEEAPLFTGLFSENGIAALFYLKQHNEFDLSSIEWDNINFYHFHWNNSSLNNITFYWNIYSRLRFDE